MKFGKKKGNILFNGGSYFLIKIGIPSHMHTKTIARGKKEDSNDYAFQNVLKGHGLKKE